MCGCRILLNCDIVRDFQRRGDKIHWLTLLRLKADRRLPPCHRNRCFLIRQLGRLCKYVDLFTSGQNTQSGIWDLLVRLSILEICGFSWLTRYSCYNAFSHLDMRVEVKIPGSLESYSIDERGDKRVATDALWLETFLCGVLRAYAFADDGSGDSIRKIVGVRRFNPVTNTEMEHKFLDAAERLFFMGSCTFHEEL